MLPDYEKTRIPEGHYKFQIVAEPEKRGHVSQATGKKFVSIHFKFKATDADGEVFDHSESMLAFEDKYADLLMALGATEIKGNLSGKTIEPVGMMFQANIVHEQDKNDSSKTWARLANIQDADNQMGFTTESDDDIPVKSPADDDSIPF